ncbi:MAG: purine-nucleoside phosphorylase [Spirochaetales bacterium]|jgi:purine-nucleoside phosphorylase|nr:purine-nucleoside phosphorylase [Spirochaetales bacterium]
MYTLEMIQDAAEYIQKKIAVTPGIGIILGSGLGVLGDEVEKAVRISYKDIPHFPRSTVEGHAGQLVVGLLEGVPVAVMQGRFHYYEGYQMDAVAFPVRVMKLLGIMDLLVTNAAGGCNPDFNAGDLMVITDHIKFIDNSPLRGPNVSEFGPRFNELSNAYTKELQRKTFQVGKELKIPLVSGVYALMAGPSFETPAEIRMLRLLGADAVGMSTVPEVITAAHAGMRILGISCITNMAAGILDKALNHEEVMETGARVSETFASLIRGVLAVW